MEDFRDQVVLVNNWATWCPPCKLKFPRSKLITRRIARKALSLSALKLVSLRVMC
ncbi:MAG: hypothetical protein IPN96_18520 [Anaerolineales bacterium]|nr:hypothetical protein [Anaerolineales bacterium]